MFAIIRNEGVEDTYELLAGIADRARDASPAFDQVASDIFAAQRKWWLLEYGGREEKEVRAGENPAYMVQTGGLLAASTVRGAGGQDVQVGPDYVLISNTHPLAAIHEGQGRPVLGDPTARDADKHAERVAEYILLGRR